MSSPTALEVEELVQITSGKEMSDIVPAVTLFTTTGTLNGKPAVVLIQLEAKFLIAVILITSPSTKTAAPSSVSVNVPDVGVAVT